MLPLPTTTELTMESLMYEASHFFNNGKLKKSYELYIQALFTAIEELKKLEFINQCVTEGNQFSSVFKLADTCLQQAKEISNTKHQRPTVPPKPSYLSQGAVPGAPLMKRKEQIIFGSHSLRKTSSLDTRRRYNRYSLSYNEKENEEDEDDEDEEDEDDEEDENDDDDNSYSYGKREGIYRRNDITATNKMKLNTVTIKRRSSTSNITPTSPITATSTSTGVISTGETLSGATVKGINPFHSIFMDDSVSIREQDLLAASCTIDPKTLVTVQISSDSLSHASENCYLPSIPQAPLVSLYQSLQHKLEESENTLAESRKKTEGNNNRQILYIQNQQLPELKTRLNRVRNIHMSATTVPTILQFQPVLIAYQLTLMDSQIIKNISVDALLTHSPKRPHPSITVSTDFFNYLTRLIEHSILLHQDASGRAQLVNHWIKVAGKCHELKNYQTLKAVISALGTPPIQRLKRSWAFVPKKSLVLLEDLTELMSESCNYGRYRELLGIHNEENLKKWPTLRNNSLVLLNEPTVPFLGTFLHDMTYLVALQQQEQANKDDPRLLELLQLFKTYQHCPPYSTSLTRGCLKELNKHRKRKLSHALTRSSPMKKTPLFFQENDTEELSVEMQQCLVTQYLLTRSWVSEKTVDELSLVREPPKTCRSYSATDTLCPPSLQPSMTSSVSLTTSHQHSLHPGLRSSSGSLTASGSSTGGESSSRTSSRPMSLEDDVMDEQKDDLKDMKNGFWLFGRKSVDQSYLKATQTTQLSEPVMTTMGGLHRSPRHFSFDELNKGKRQPETMRIQREGSQGSFTLFRKDFWKSEEKKQDTIKPKTLTRRGSYSSLVPHQPNDSSSSPPPDQQRTYNTISPGKLKHALSSPHPLDASAKTTYNDSIMQWRQ